MDATVVAVVSKLDCSFALNKDQKATMNTSKFEGDKENITKKINIVQ